jgi:hypothetical protein
MFWGESMSQAFRTVLHGRRVEVTCLGSDDDWLCRVANPRDKSRLNDAYYPYWDFGFLSIRKRDERWLASGMVHRSVFRDAGTIDHVLEEIMQKVIKIDWSLARCIELVDARHTSISSGEEGPLFFEGGGDDCQWGPIR